MKKALGLVLLVTFFIGAVSAWTFFEQERRHRDELERLSRPRPLARLTVVERTQSADGNWRTTVEVVRLDAESKSLPPVTCALEGFEALLPDGSDGKPEPVAPGAVYDLLLNAERELRLVPVPASE